MFMQNYMSSFYTDHCNPLFKDLKLPKVPNILKSEVI